MDITADFRKLARWTDATEEAKPVSDFMQDALSVLKSVQRISSLVASQRKSYIDPVRFLPSKAAAFSDLERDELEDSVLDSYAACEQQIDALKEKIHQGLRAKKPQTTKMHVEVVSYLNDRVKRAVQNTKSDRKQRVSRPFFASQRFLPDTVELHAPKSSAPTSVPTSSATHQLATTPPPTAEAPASDELNEPIGDFTPEESQRFHAENIQLHQHLHEEIAAARQLEASMNEISRIMGQFSDNIEVQHGDLQAIADNASTTSTNVVEGNRLLEKAYDYGTNRGFTIFCFYAAASVLILAMHYY
ncbi:hypothetical protein ACHHYP_09340 [Achlya hypogyna]|uniref:t-SNARE coiled-coil homology domain-containing protein n=1 Tax=Achlya hypogyna TaxID=1202772 RepID=A0A1V9YNG5_ACHHY|nr:hypothetical protein ACHHYP_09340 [Achlya hypogyna]